MYPDCCVEEDVVAQLLEQRRSVRQTVQVLCKGQELLQHGPGDVHSRRLGERREKRHERLNTWSDASFSLELANMVNTLVRSLDVQHELLFLWLNIYSCHGSP